MRLPKAQFNKLLGNLKALNKVLRRTPAKAKFDAYETKKGLRGITKQGKLSAFDFNHGLTNIIGDLTPKGNAFYNELARQVKKGIIKLR